MANSDDSCTHPSVYGTLCVVCGADVGQDGTNKDDYHTILHDNAHLKMNKSHRELDVQKESQALHQKKQLICILDLDQTILHCLIGKEDENDDILSFYLQQVPYNIYFRQHLNVLLDTLDKEYTTHIYTMGTNDYCEQIKNYLIHKWCFNVKKRWMGRDLNVLPGEEAHMKSIHRFNCPVDFSIVLDDRMEVWKQPHNVIPILPFYHALNGDIHGSDRFKLYQNVVFRMDNHLLYVNRVLQHIHYEFYKVDNNNVWIPNTVPNLLKNALNIFKDCYFVLTGFIPNSSTSIPMVHLIEKYGGIVMDVVDEKTTHCICMYVEEHLIIDQEQFKQRPSMAPTNPDEDEQIISFLTRKSKLHIKTTDKVKAAKNKCYLLPPEWVYLSCYSYCKLNETKYNYENMLPTSDPIERSKEHTFLNIPASNNDSVDDNVQRSRQHSASSLSSSDLDTFADDLEHDFE